MQLRSEALTGPVALRHTLQAAIVVAAGVAGYVTVLPLSPQFHQVEVAAAEQPVWAGHIEHPEMDAVAPAPQAPVTSASYLVQEPVAAVAAARKNGTTVAAVNPVAVSPKTPVKPMILPPRRPAASEDIVKVSVAAKPADSELAALIPPADIPETPPQKPAPRNVLSRVTEHLPTTGTLLKPFRAVGDSFHNFIKSF